MSDIQRGLAVKERIPLNRVRKAMARGMKASVETLALSQVNRELDLTRLQSARRGGNGKISLNTLLMAAVARTLPNHRWLNAELIGNDIVLYDPINLGMAVATPSGLVVTVIQHADLLSVMEMDGCIQTLVSRARSGELALDDIEGGTFTVSNLGMFGVDSGLALPRPPESGVILFGAVRPRPLVVDGIIVIGETCWAALTYDHRFIDGAMAGAFLEDLHCLLGDPEILLESTREHGIR